LSGSLCPGPQALGHFQRQSIVAALQHLDDELHQVGEAAGRSAEQDDGVVVGDLGRPGLSGGRQANG
jgi:hypothetical protein